MKKLVLSLFLILPFAPAKASVMETYNFQVNGYDSYSNDDETINILTPVIFTGSYTVDLDMLAVQGDPYNGPQGGGYYSYSNSGVGDFSSGRAFTAFSMTEKVISNGQQVGSFGLNDIAYYQLYLNQHPLDTTKSLLNNEQDNLVGYFRIEFPLAGVYPNYNYLGSDGARGVSFNLVSPVPEPSSYVLGFAGLLGMIGFASRKKKTEAAAV
jgi:PEP-CTERM motif